MQNSGSPMPTSFTSTAGRSTAVNASTPYFTYLNGLSLPVDSFLPGILCSSSCSQPNGHKNPHTKRPSSTPVKIKNPVT